MIILLICNMYIEQKSIYNNFGILYFNFIFVGDFEIDCSNVFRFIN